MRPEDSEERFKASRSDALGAMYVLGAIVIALAGLAIVVLMFVPSREPMRTEGEGVWVPGSLPQWNSGRSALRQLLEPAGVTPLDGNRTKVVLVSYNWSFMPDSINIPLGSEVTFHTRSEQDYHGFALIGTPLVISFQPNQVKETTYTFDTPGTYRFVCAEYCGAGHPSMAGTLVVE